MAMAAAAAASWMKVGSVCNLRPRERLLLTRWEGRGCPEGCWVMLTTCSTADCEKHRGLKAQ